MYKTGYADEDTHMRTMLTRIRWCARWIVAALLVMGAAPGADAAMSNACLDECAAQQQSCLSACSGCEICPVRAEGAQSDVTRLPDCPWCYSDYDACVAACPPPEPDPDAGYTGVVLEQGEGWELVNASGWTFDDGGQAYNRNLYMIHNAEGAYIAPLPASIQADISASVSGEDSVVTVDQQIAHEIEISEQQGYLTPYLETLAEPLDGTPETPDAVLAGCSDSWISKSKTVNLSTPVTLAQGSFGGGFSGQLTLNGNAQGTATGEIHIRVKRFRLLWWCIPYGVRFDRARAYGNVAVNYAATLSGTVNYTNPSPWEWQLAKPHLFSFDFWAGPIPVHIGVNLPITAGLDLTASVTGSVSYNSGQSAQGPFDYTCRLSGCTGSSNIVQTGSSSPQTLTGSLSGRIRPTVHAEAAVRAYLYTEWLAYAQVGVRPYLYGDLWGYYGNNCGDADGDGWYETVDALTFDLDWQLKVTAAARAFGANPSRWTLWSSSVWHIGYWDLIGSDAISPILSGPASVPVNTSQRYDSKMRPCWPYSDNVNYNLNWGDATSVNFSGAPQSFVPNYKTWTTTGAKGLQLSALSDAHGRGLNKSTSRTVQVTNGTWTAWLNRDAPSGTGDWETLVDFRAAGTNVCGTSTPVDIECRTIVGGIDYRATGEVYSCTPSVGGICQNVNQPDGACLDYEVRFLCP